MEAAMARTVRMLLLWALILLAAGWFLYQFGSELNVEVATQDQAPWDQAPGDKWLYVGGLMMLISGSLAVAAVKVWRGSRQQTTSGRLNWPEDRSA